MTNIQTSQLIEEHSFLTLGSYSGKEYIGIVQNKSKNIISMYCLDTMLCDNIRRRFLELGKEWWDNSNKTISIELFLKPDFDVFKPFLKHFSVKEFVIVGGCPAVSMSNISKKKTKIKNIQLIRSK